MPVDEDGFDYEWDVKDPDGMNVTERKLYNALIAEGLDPKPQYKISLMTVDFAFPDVNMVVEVNGPHHDTDEQKLIDKKRWFALNNLGWKRRTFSANQTYYYPETVAKRVKNSYDKLKGEGVSGNETKTSKASPEAEESSVIRKPWTEDRYISLDSTSLKMKRMLKRFAIKLLQSVFVQTLEVLFVMYLGLKIIVTQDDLTPLALIGMGLVFLAAPIVVYANSFFPEEY